MPPLLHSVLKKIGNANHRCQLCSLVVRNNPANPGGLFGILQNCRCIFCASCIAAKHSKRKKSCPICLVTSNQRVNCAVFIASDSKKAKILFRTNENVPDSVLRCQLCWKVVRNNPGGQFAITTVCFCVICASCITDDHRKSMKCPVCNKTSNRIENHSKFIRLEKDKQLVFNRNSNDSVAEELLRCQLCLLEVQNNPANPGGFFGILRNCLCIFCASCIAAKHSNSKNNCPICLVTSKRLVNCAVFLKSEILKLKILFRAQCPNVPNCILRCQLCTLEVQNNPANLGGQFAITTSCFCAICASCFTKDYRRSMKCPVCNKTSKRIENHSRFIESKYDKDIFFNKIPNIQTKTLKCQLSQPGPSKSISRSTVKPSPNSLPLSSNARSIPETITENSVSFPKPNVSKDSALRCQLCSLEVQNNPANSGGQFGILRNCCCIFCASCIKHSSRKNKCPICLVTSRRLVRHSEFITTDSEKLALFVPKINDSGLRCQLCLLEVRNIGEHLFGILENCQCVFCAGCIGDQRRITKQCPICHTNSRRVLNQSEFPSSQQEKQSFYANLLSSVQNLHSISLPTTVECQLSQPCSSQSLSQFTIEPIPNFLPVSTNAIPKTVDQPLSLSPTTVECQLSQPGPSRTLSQFTVEPSPNSLPISTKVSIPVDQPSSLPPTTLECQLSQPGPSQSFLQFTVEPSHNLLSVSAKVSNLVERPSSLQPTTVECQLSQPCSSQSLSLPTVELSPNFLPVSTNAISKTVDQPSSLQPTTVECQLSQPTGQPLLQFTVEPSPNLLSVSAKVLNPVDQPSSLPTTTVACQLSQPGPSQSFSQFTVKPSPNSLPVSTISIPKTVDQPSSLQLTNNPPPTTVVCQLSQPGPSRTLSQFTVVEPNPNLLSVSAKVLNPVERHSTNNPTVECQLSQPGQSMSLSTVVPSPNSLPVSTKVLNLTDQPSSLQPTNVESQLSQPGQPFSQFNLAPSPKLLSISTKVSNPVAEFPNSPSDQHFVDNFILDYLSSQTWNKPSKFRLQCQLCWLEVQNNSTTNPDGMFGILQNCLCIFCSSCILYYRKHSNNNNCPVCLVSSDRIVNCSEFPVLHSEKSPLFSAPELSQIDSEVSTSQINQSDDNNKLRCQVCSLIVRQNPVNLGGQFAITTRCFCVICASCITEDYLETKQCPVCGKQSRRIVDHRFFLRTLDEKELLFWEKFSGDLNNNNFENVQTKPIEDNLRCQLPQPTGQSLSRSTVVPNPNSLPVFIKVLNLTDQSLNVESQLSQPTGQSLSLSTVVPSPNLLHVSTKVLNLTDQPPNVESQLSQPTGQSLSLSTVVPSPNLLHVSTKVSNLTDQPPNVESQLSQPTGQSLSLSTVVPSPKLLPVSNKVSNPVDRPLNLESQLSQPTGQSLSRSTVVPSPNSLPVSTKVFNLTDQPPTVESQLSQPGPSKSMSLSTVVPSPNSLPFSSNSQSIPKTITENSVLCPKPNISKNSSLRCQICSLEVQNNPANPDGKFGILQNCLCIFCAHCIEAKHINNRKKACPICLVTSTRLVIHSEFVESESEKRKIFYKKTKDSELRCQLCLLEVQNNPINSSGQFAITTVCFCVICASCLTDDHRRSMKCPVCSGTSKRFEINSQFIRTIKDKQLLFQKISSNIQKTSNILRSFDDVVLRCQLCSLEVQNNPANPGGLFGILQNCHCIFCASCISVQHNKRKKFCPICLVTSKILVKHSEFVEVELEKRKLFKSKFNKRDSDPCKLS